MHQPYYMDDKAQRTFMPWVFLHSIKDYYDLPFYGSGFRSIRATYNLVPSLMYQIRSYIDGSAHDKLLELIAKPVEDLGVDDKEFLESYLFLANDKNMIRPFPRYEQIYIKYKAHNQLDLLSDEEVHDLQVLFLLSWCGNFLRKNNKVVKKLIHKQQFFTHEDKITLVDELIKFLSIILEFYKELEKKGQIAISTTPYYHPITPLLLDIQSAIEAKYNTNLPDITETFDDFGKQNTQLAIAYYENIFGKKPNGFWPAEGGVSMQTAALFANNDIRWFCTDEEILFKTTKSHDKRQIYKNYILHIGDKQIDIRFRDRYLSDLIGFEYAKKEPQNAAKDFLSHLQNIYNACNFSPLVNVILDGENAWEFFPNNAQDFFYELYKEIERAEWIECVTQDQISNDPQITSDQLSNLASGSWINGNFDIWIGSKEKNLAWELLDSAKKEYEKNKQFLNDKTKALIEREFMIAFGSDWFWWYGDDHFTPLASQFDELFRKHLINIYEYMGSNVPKEILTPTISFVQQRNGYHIKPTNYIFPAIDGKKSNFFEWFNSGYIDISKEFSVMDSKHSMIKEIRYGYNKEKLYFMFDSKANEFNDDMILRLCLNEKCMHIEIVQGKHYLDFENFAIELFCDKYIIELSIDRKHFHINEIKFSFSLEEKNSAKVIQTFPIYKDFFIGIEDLELRNWYI